jgi:hypothetical protein
MFGGTKALLLNKNLWQYWKHFAHDDYPPKQMFREITTSMKNKSKKCFFLFIFVEFFIALCSTKKKASASEWVRWKKGFHKCYTFIIWGWGWQYHKTKLFAVFGVYTTASSAAAAQKREKNQNK